MSVLVTGGAGYIGSHTVRALRARGREVVVLDNLDAGHRGAVLDAPLVVGDIADQDLVAKVLAEYDVDAVLHFAASKAAGESVHVPEKYFRNNVGGSLALLDVTQQAGIRHFVFSSTCAVYGTPDVLPVSEANRLHPESPYGQSKLMVEEMLPWFEQAHGLRFVSLRYFNAAGAASDGVIGEDWTVTLNLVPIVMKAALGLIDSLDVFGTDYPTPDGTAIRDYIHVEDLAEAHALALEHLEGGGESTTINLGTGKGSTVREVIETTRRVSGRTITTVDRPRRAGDPEAVFADNRKAAEVLGWRPDRTLDEVIASAWRWHSTHPDGYGD